MSAENLIYWLNGFFELSGAATLNEQQVKIVKDHIALVIRKETSKYVGITVPPNNPNIVLYPAYPSDTIKPPTDWNCSTVTQDAIVDVPTHLSC